MFGENPIRLIYLPPQFDPMREVSDWSAAALVAFALAASARDRLQARTAWADGYGVSATAKPGRELVQADRATAVAARPQAACPLRPALRARREHSPLPQGCLLGEGDRVKQPVDLCGVGVQLVDCRWVVLRELRAALVAN
eukprot:15445981-Alexandrium_andersonii.AAC.1